MPSSNFNISLSTSPLNKSDSELLLLPCFAKNKGLEKKEKEIQAFPKVLEFLDPALAKQIKTIWQEEDFQAEADSAIYLPYLDQKHKRILLCGLGDIEKAKGYTIEKSLNPNSKRKSKTQRNQKDTRSHRLRTHGLSQAGVACVFYYCSFFSI